MTDVTVRKLTPELVDDYLQFFAEDAFSDNPDWSGCYCYFHHFTGTSEQWQSRSSEENRAAVRQSIQSGEFDGVLAYRAGRPVGWCKALIRDRLPDPERVAPPSNQPYEQVGVVLCFIVSPDHRRRGIARELLAEACHSLEREGASVVEGYPLKDAETSAEHCQGPLALYDDAGFELVMEEEDGPRTVMRKSL